MRSTMLYSRFTTCATTAGSASCSSSLDTLPVPYPSFLRQSLTTLLQKGGTAHWLRCRHRYLYFTLYGQSLQAEAILVIMSGCIAASSTLCGRKTVLRTPPGTALSGTPLMRFSMCAPTVRPQAAGCWPCCCAVGYDRPQHCRRGCCSRYSGCELLYQDLQKAARHYADPIPTRKESDAGPLIGTLHTRSCEKSQQKIRFRLKNVLPCLLLSWYTGYRMRQEQSP